MTSLIIYYTKIFYPCKVFNFSGIDLFLNIFHPKKRAKIEPASKRYRLKTTIYGVFI